MSKTLIKPALWTLSALAAGAIIAESHIGFPARSHAAVISTEKTVSAPPPSVTADVRALSDAFSALAERVSPAVVNIYTSSSVHQRPQLPPGFDDQLLQRYFGFSPFSFPQMKREALGSGFVINAKDGYIVTNAHVVRMTGQNADEIMVKFKGEDGENQKGHPAKIIGVDEVSDVALLKLTDKKLPDLKALSFGDSSKARVGEWVLAIGNPYGHTNTVTQGIVSGTGRNLEGTRSEFLQTSAGINPGNSGGPLINMNGEVIGINSAMDPRAQNIGFAIPSNTVKDVITQLADKGRVERAWLGIGIEDISDEAAAMLKMKQPDGVLVKQVVDGAPAAKAGIEQYDVIRKIDGSEIHNTHDLFKAIGQLPAGKTAQVQVLRGGNLKTVNVRLGEMPANT